MACQQAKAVPHAPFGLLNRLHVHYAAWASTSVDLITPIPKSAGYTGMIVLVNHFTKMA